MQTKGFLPSFLATFLSVGVIATPTGVEPRDIKSTHGWDGAVTSFEEVAIAVGDRNPRSNGRIITPKDNDVPVVSTSVEARDPESFSKRTAGCIFVTDSPNFTGNSAYICIITNSGCNNWSTYWRLNIGSFGPEIGTTCQIFTSPNCDGIASVAFGYPGYGNLGTWDENMGSFSCWW